MNQMAIERNREALKRMLALLFFYIGLADDTRRAARLTDGPARALAAPRDPATILRRVHRMICQLLLPVEAATRRLIVVLAAGLPPPHPDTSGIAPAGRNRQPLPDVGVSATPLPISNDAAAGGRTRRLPANPASLCSIR